MNISQAKRRAWKEFSRFVRLRDCLATTGTTTHGVCCTCGSRFEFAQLHAGHWISGRTNSLLFDERNCHAQCAICNHDGGRLEQYDVYMSVRYGADLLEDLRSRRHVAWKMGAGDFLELAQAYRARNRSMER